MMNRRDSSPYDFWLEYDSNKFGFRVFAENGVKGWRQGFAPSIAPQVRDSDYSYQHLPPEIDIAVPFEDWHIGAGAIDGMEDTHAGQNEFHGTHAYNYSRGIDLSWPHRAYLSPQRQSALIGGAEIAAAPTKFIQSTLGYFCIAGDYIYEWVVSSSDWTTRDSGGGTDYTDIVEMDGVLYAARGDSADYKYSTDGITWTAFTDADRNFKYFCVRGQSSGEAVLWGITNTGTVRNTTNGANSGVAWSSTTALGHTSDTTNGFLEVDDKIYAFRREGIYRFDGTTVEDVWTGGRQMMRDGNGKNPFLWVDKKVYVPYGDRLIQFDAGGADGNGTIITVWPTAEGVGNTELNGTVSSISGDADNLYFTIKNSAGNTYVMKGNPQRGAHGFHTFAYLGANDCNASFVAGPTVVVTSNPVLMFGYGTGARYFILPRSGLRPEDDTNYRFDTAAGVVYGTWVDAGAKAYKKFLNGGRAIAQNVSAGNPITFAYELDDGSEATLINIAQPGESSAIISNGTEFNRIRYVIRMQTADEDTSPRLLGVIFNVMPNPPRKRVWAIDAIAGDDGTQRGGGASRYTGRQAVFFLEGSAQKRITLYDRRGRTFTVRLLDWDGLGLFEGADDTEIFRLSMVEINETTETDNVFVLNQDALNSGKVLA